MQAMTETSQLKLWKSDFGRSYTDRNDYEKPERVTSWERVLEGIAPKRVLEVGCNVGWNLVYLTRVGVPELYGVEPQRYAVERARQRCPDFGVLQGTAFDLPFRDGFFDMVFTSGVMIHIGPQELPLALDEIYRCSRRWIVAIEYDHATEQEVEYRGHAGALWKRDHGKVWQARYPSLREIRTIKLGTADGYDDCTAHVFEKRA